MTKDYDITVHSVMGWAKHELHNVGYLIGTKDKDIQYAYAQSVVNGMLHLRDALYQLVTNPAYADKKDDLLKTHDEVVRVIKHLIKDFHVSLEEIKRFNTHHVLSDLSYLNAGKNNRKTRKTRKNRS
jgi:hypothetical protein